MTEIRCKTSSFFSYAYSYVAYKKGFCTRNNSDKLTTSPDRNCEFQIRILVGSMGGMLAISRVHIKLTYVLLFYSVKFPLSFTPHKVLVKFLSRILPTSHSCHKNLRTYCTYILVESDHKHVRFCTKFTNAFFSQIV